MVFTAICVFCTARTSTASSTQGNQPQSKVDEQFVVGKVQSVSDAQVNAELLRGTGMMSKHQMVKVEVLEGPFKGCTIMVPNELTDNPAFNVNVKTGQEFFPLSRKTDASLSLI